MTLLTLCTTAGTMRGFQLTWHWPQECPAHPAMEGLMRARPPGNPEKSALAPVGGRAACTLQACHPGPGGDLKLNGSGVKSAISTNCLVIKMITLSSFLCFQGEGTQNHLFFLPKIKNLNLIMRKQTIPNWGKFYKITGCEDQESQTRPNPRPSLLLPGLGPCTLRRL